MDLSFFTDGRALLFLTIATSFYYFVLNNNQLQKKAAPRSGVSLCFTYDVFKITEILWAKSHR